MSLKAVSPTERSKNSGAAICAAIKMPIAPSHNLETVLKDTPPGHSRRETNITVVTGVTCIAGLSGKRKPAMYRFLPVRFLYSIICGNSQWTGKGPSEPESRRLSIILENENSARSGRNAADRAMARDRTGFPGCLNSRRHSDGSQRNFGTFLGCLWTIRVLHGQRHPDPDAAAEAPTIHISLSVPGARGRHRLAGCNLHLCRGS